MRVAEGPLRRVVAGRADRLADLLNDPDPARAAWAMQAMFGMKKLDIAALEAAADGA